MAIRVKAIRRGFYGRLREVGDEFPINDRKDLGRWMQPLDAEKAEKQPPQKSADGDTTEKPKAGELVAQIEASEDIEFIQAQLDSGFATVKKAAEARLEQLRG